MADEKPLTLDTWLEGKNKSAFAAACGFKHTQQLFSYLRRKDGRPPRKRMTLHTALRVVQASGGELTLEDLALTATPPQRKAA